MRLTWRDGLASVFVGVAASVTAVVYGVGAGLLRVSKVYLVIASLIGLIAFAAGVVALVNESELMLGVLVVSTVALWMMATVRHANTVEAKADVLSLGASYKHAA